MRRKSVDGDVHVQGAPAGEGTDGVCGVPWGLLLSSSSSARSSTMYAPDTADTPLSMVSHASSACQY